jgi:hypothetical protein
MFFVYTQGCIKKKIIAIQCAGKRDRELLHSHRLQAGPARSRGKFRIAGQDSCVEKQFIQAIPFPPAE